MAFYLEEYPTAAALGGNVVASAWSRHRGQALLAAATADGAISLYLEEGESFTLNSAKSASSSSSSSSAAASSIDAQPASTITRTHKVTSDSGLEHKNLHAMCLDWHPTRGVLAAGWEDGGVSVWHRDEQMLREDTTAHTAPICMVVWSPEGSRLITGDESGVVTVWQLKNASHPRLTVVCRYEKDGAIRHCVFRTKEQEQPVPSQSMNSALRSQSFDSMMDAATSSAATAPCPSFFFCGRSGMVFFADDLGNCSQIVKLNSSVKWLHFAGGRPSDQSKQSDYLVILTEDVVLYKYEISAQGRVTQTRKVKLSIKGDGSALCPVWAGSGLLAAANDERRLRVWSLDSDDNYILAVNESGKYGNDSLISVDFSPSTQVLCAGTASGRVLMWKYIGNTRRRDKQRSDAKELKANDRKTADDDSDDDEPLASEEDWELLPVVDIKSPLPINALRWRKNAESHGLLAVTMKHKLSVLAETVLHCKSAQGASAVQVTVDTLHIQPRPGKTKEVRCSIRIKGLDVCPQAVVIWNYKQAETYSIHKGNVSLLSTFATAATMCRLHCVGDNESLYRISGSQVEECSLQGVVKKRLKFSDHEGQPIHIDINQNYLAVLTSNAFIKLWDIARREPRQILPARAFADIPHISSVHVNANGTKLALMSATVQAHGFSVPSSTLNIYDVDTDNTLAHDFGPARYPTRLCWDTDEHKLLAVETRKYTSAEMRRRSKEEKKSAVLDDEEIPDAEISTFFATGDDGILQQDTFTIDPLVQSLMGFSVPAIVLLSRPTPSATSTAHGIPRVKRHIMRDFLGLENSSEEAKQDLINFSYYLTVGNLDEAHRAVRRIKNPAIWKNMAHMCVKTKRLDVAEVCLGNMGDAVGARAVRHAKEAGDHPDAIIAVVALQLGMVDEALKLFKACQRYDKVVEIHKARGKWQDALNTCDKHDRIHLRSTHFARAKHLESRGDVAGAVKEYELSDTHTHEVPRMLFDRQRIGDLEQYVRASPNEEKLVQWWAQYCEGRGRYDDALRYYELAKDTLSLVRVFAFKEDFDKARQLCMDTGDKAACYHLAKQFARKGNIAEAIMFFTRAKRFNHAIRLALEHDMPNELMKLALESNKSLKLRAARYFEKKEMYDRAVLFYQKGGDVGRALQLCFDAKLFDSLRNIAEELGKDTDPALLSRAAGFFLNNAHYEKAAQLLVTARQYTEALEICVRHNVTITEKLAEDITPPKDADKQMRINVLRKVGELCFQQQNFNVACKKFTQAGDKVQAMKCLLKSNDVEKITYYAGKARSRQVLILAANYLQNLDWHNKPNIMSTIARFLTKAKAMLQLARYYEMCSSNEVDEYRDYEKALNFLKEAMKCVIKAKDVDDKEREAKLSVLEGRIRMMERFVEARQLVKTNPRRMSEICTELIDNQDESAIRVGDVYALLIEYYYSKGAMDDAYALMRRMKDQGIILEPYLEQAMVLGVLQAVGAPPDSLSSAPQQAGPPAGAMGPSDDIPEDIEEDIPEDIGGY